MKLKNYLLSIFAILLLFNLTACQPKEKTPLVVFGAGSLIIPFDQIEAAFEKAHPEIDVLSEYHGSIQVIRHVSELHESIDVVASADQALIPMLMYDSHVPETGVPYADWNIRFATNRMAIAYSDQSKYADEINEQNWTEILTRDDVKVGIADPRFDAAGYRAFMVFKLAEPVYQKPALFFDMFSGQFTMPFTVSEQDGLSTIHVPEIVETKKTSHVVIRGASIQLIALLESGDLDYAFDYESVVQQHGLKMVSLPPEVNLGTDGYADQYKSVVVKEDFKRFASVEPIFGGEQISYGITIPSNAPHAKEAIEYIQFLLGPEGQKIMAENHHPLLNPLVGNQYDQIPSALQALCVPESTP
ncbi:MAG: tungstate ABC transporter substrate-binding protein WtpA [Anaerolineaceae bacterium]